MDQFVLAQKAKSKGGDKYVCASDPSFSIYVPQSRSREGDNVHQNLYIFISPVPVPVPVPVPKLKSELE